jgi:hypothetical protein
MKYYKSKIKTSNYRYQPAEGYKRKDKLYILPHYKIIKYPKKKKAM